MAWVLLLCVLCARAAVAQSGEGGESSPTVVAVELHLPGGADAQGLSGLVAVRKGQTLSPGAVRRSLEQLWATGRFTDVVARAVDVPGGVRLVFQLTPVARLARLRFEGNAVLSEGELIDASGLLEGGPLDAEELEGAVSAVLQAYQRKGYDSAKVTARQEPVTDGVAVTLIVDEGVPTRVKMVTFSGSPGLPLPRLLEVLELRPGEVFDRARLDTGLDGLRTLLREAGHWRAQVGTPAVLVEGSAASVAVPLAAGPRYEVRFHGNHRFPPALLERVLAHDTAESLDEVVAGRLARRVESFYRYRGFHDVRVRPRDVVRPDGERAALVFDVEEGQSLKVTEVRFHGNAGLGSERLRTLLVDRVRAGEPRQDLDLRLLDDPLDVEGRHGPEVGELEPPPDPSTVYVEDAWLEAMDAMNEAYREEGFLSAVVTFRGLTVDVTGRTAVADFDVEEGPQARVVDVRFEGVPKEVPLLAANAKVRRGDPLSFDKVEEARQALEYSLAQWGYLFSRATTETGVGEDGQAATVVFRADPGPQVRVGKILVQGLTRTDLDLVLGNLNLEEGKPVALEELTEGQRRLARLGVFRQVDVALADPTRREETKDVLVSVQERPRLDGEVSGGYFLVDGPRISVDAAYRNLDGLGLSLLARGKVNYAGWSAEALSEDRRVACDQRTPDGGVAPGCDAELQGLSGLGGRGNLALAQPRLFFLLPLEVGARLDLIGERVHRPSYVSTRFAAAAALNWAAASWLNLSLSYEVENNRLRSRAGVLELLNRADQERLRYPFGDFTLHSLRPSATLDFRDDPANPRRGVVFVSSAEFTRGLSVRPTDVAGNRVTEYPIDGVKLSSNLSGYIPLGRRASVALSARAGTIIPLEPEAQAIGSKLFYLGGSSSLRGFREDGVLPEDVRGVVRQRLQDCRALITPSGCSAELKAVLAGQVPASQGGELFTLGKAELRLPALTSLDLGLFFEAGNLWLDRTQFDPGRLRYAAGAGLRYVTPVGPLAFDVGFNLDPDEAVNEATTQFHFSIGTF
ncbi:POTRA domain-containing protein [Pyxidicoccus xibeiensis]|uniref:POTRA domain-containing protein n=1 Tax=Pyxidicoccus xibeiensis TaxID=2906759 RepID=UPI0020A7078C|nr:POTRA domain-containing protein [Pyxidicoccus xibeiensis]MCP3144010.1 BamA/TamA family outer membrane protein [Pyxidicoccus xibeiensis]